MFHRFESFVTGITVCYKCIQRIKTMEMTEYGLKGAHAMCLFFLHHNPQGLTAAQLCQLCAEDKAAISRTLAILHEKEYIHSDDKKYRALLFLTEEGGRIAREVDELIEQWVSFGSSGLTEKDRAAFYRALDVIAGNLKKSLDKAGKE